MTFPKQSLVSAVLISLSFFVMQSSFSNAKISFRSYRKLSISVLKKVASRWKQNICFRHIFGHVHKRCCPKNLRKVQCHSIIRKSENNSVTTKNVLLSKRDFKPKYRFFVQKMFDSSLLKNRTEQKM